MDELSRSGAPDEQEERASERTTKGRDHPIRRRLGSRSVVLVGLMGAGKSTVGRRLATKLALPFFDADQEIESAAGMSVQDIFSVYGEPYFREGERKVIARLLQEGPIVLATGGGAFMNEETRATVARAGLSIWLRAELPVLMRRVRKRANRPLLNTEDPEDTMRRLIAIRYPVYAQADLTVESHEAPHDRVVAEVMRVLSDWLEAEAPR
jgi:shikimate kinase